MVVYNRFLFKSYNKLYKIIDVNTGVYIFAHKILFDEPITIRDKKEDYTVIRKNNKIIEFKDSILPMMIEFTYQVRSEGIIFDSKTMKMEIQSVNEWKKICKKYDIYNNIIMFNDSYMNLKIPDKVKKYVKKLNEDIKKKCKELKIMFDFVYKLEYVPSDILLLCLYYQEQCISNVYYTISEDGIKLKMDLYTLEEHQRKKYNLFLCSIGIMISQIYDLKKLYLNAQSPITVNMFHKYFKCKYNRNFTKFIENKDVTMENIHEYFDKNAAVNKVADVDVFVDLDEENIERANVLYHKFLDKKSEMKCP
jgi:hypothetical protein